MVATTSEESLNLESSDMEFRYEGGRGVDVSSELDIWIGVGVVVVEKENVELAWWEEGLSLDIWQR